MLRTALFVALLVSCADAWRNEGRQFQLIFPPVFNWGLSGMCQLVISSRTSGNIYVDAPFLSLNETRTITAFGRQVFTLSTTARPLGPGLDNEAVYIYSDVDIVVAAYNYVTSTGSTGGQRAAYLLSPTTNDDTYVIHSHVDSHSSTPPHGYYTAVATEDITQVIVYRPEAAGGYTLEGTFTLNRGQCYNNISDVAQDITGYKFVSAKPISIISGHSNIKLSLETAWRTQTIGSSVFPVRALGRNYIVPGIAGADPISCEIRVIAVNPGQTWVTHDSAGNVTLAEGKFTSFTRSDKTRASVISCSQACSVALYTYQDNSGSYAGSFQLPIVPETAFTSGGLVVVTPDSPDTATNHYLAIVVEGTDTTGILLNGAALGLTWTQHTVAGGLTYSFGTTTITDGAHSLTSGTKRLAGYIFGHFTVDLTRGMSYGYPAGYDNLYDVTTPAPSTTTTSPGSSTTPPPVVDPRNAPGYEFTLQGNFTSVNASTGGAGAPFTQACINTYSTDLEVRAVDIGVTVNNLVGVSMCLYLAADDMRLETASTSMETFEPENTRGSAEIDYISSSKNHLRFEDTVACADEMAKYLSLHSNWGFPILPTRPGCPFVNFTTNFWTIPSHLWYCRDNTGAINLPNYVVPLYSNFTTYTAEPLTPTCTQAYSDQMERQAQDQVRYINGQIGVSICTNISGVSVGRVTTVFASNSANTGITQVSFYIYVRNSALRYIDVMVCADEIASKNSALATWGQPLLTQEPGCPLLQFQDPFRAEEQYWFCFS